MQIKTTAILPGQSLGYLELVLLTTSETQSFKTTTARSLQKRATDSIKSNGPFLKLSEYNFTIFATRVTTTNTLDSIGKTHG
jgi:hypothetical protein